MERDCINASNVAAALTKEVNDLVNITLFLHIKKWQAVYESNTC